MDQQNDNRLAYEIASALNDKEALHVYIAFVQKISRGFSKANSSTSNVNTG